MPFILPVPTHLEGRNPLVGCYTARELVPVVAGVFAAAGVLGQPHLAMPGRIGEALALAVLGSVVGLARPGGRPLLAWGRLIAAHLLSERVSAWVPPASALAVSAAAPYPSLRPPHLVHALGQAAKTPTPPTSPPVPSSDHTPRRTRCTATAAHPFIPVNIADDTVVFPDGHRCAILECSGVSVEGLDGEQQQALHAAYHAVLLGLAFPVQMLVCADPVNPAPYAARRLAHLAGRSLVVRRLGSADAAYMRRALAQAGALDLHIYVVISDATGSAPSMPRETGILTLLPTLRRHLAAGRFHAVATGPDEEAASQLLAEPCAALREGLAQAGVHAWRLDTPALQALYYRSLCPRTARLQPFDAGHAAPVVTARVRFDDVIGKTDDADAPEDDDDTIVAETA